MKKTFLSLLLLFSISIGLYFIIVPVSASTTIYEYQYEFDGWDVDQYPTNDGNQLTYNIGTNFIAHEVADPMTYDLDLSDALTTLKSMDEYNSGKSNSFYDWSLQIIIGFDEPAANYIVNYSGFDSFDGIADNDGLAEVINGSYSEIIIYNFRDTDVPSLTSFQAFISSSTNALYNLESIRLTMTGETTIPDEPTPEEPTTEEPTTEESTTNEPPTTSDGSTTEPPTTSDGSTTEVPTTSDETTTESSIPDEPDADSYYYDLDVPFTDISIEDNASNIIAPTNLLIDTEYFYQANLLDTKVALKALDQHKEPGQPDNAYQWTILVKYKLDDEASKYSPVVYGFQEVLDLVSPDGVYNYDQVAADLQTVYYDYHRDEFGVMTTYAYVSANLGYVSIPDMVNFQSLIGQIGTDNPGYELDSITLRIKGYNTDAIVAGSHYEGVASDLLLDRPISTTSMDLIDEASNSWTINFIAAGIHYSYDVNIPDAMSSYSEVTSMNVTQFYTMVTELTDLDTDITERKLIFLIRSDINDINPIEVNDLGYTIPNELAKYSAINLTDMTYIHTNQVKINGIVNKESNYNAYLYTSIPIQMDDLLSIRLSYNFRFNYLNSVGSWQSADSDYQKDETYDTAPPRWLWWLSLPTTLPYTIADATNFYNIDQIEPTDTFTDDIYVKFNDELSVTESQLLQTELFKIHLGQFRDTWSTGYDIDKVVVLELTYSENGLVYEVPYEVIESNVYVPEEEGSLVDGLIDDLPDFDFVPEEVGQALKLFTVLLGVIAIIWVSKTIIKMIKSIFR
jgi:hypothetical protein